MKDFTINYTFGLPAEPAPARPNDGLDQLYLRVQRFKKGDAVPVWLKHIEPPDPHVSVTFARDCEVLRHESQHCSTIWPVEGFKRLEPRLFFEVKNLRDGSDVAGDCQFFTQQRS